MGALVFLHLQILMQKKNVENENDGECDTCFVSFVSSFSDEVSSRLRGVCLRECFSDCIIIRRCVKIHILSIKIHVINCYSGGNTTFPIVNIEALSDDGRACSFTISLP